MLLSLFFDNSARWVQGSGEIFFVEFLGD